MSDETNVSSAEIVDTGDGHIEQHEGADRAADHEAEREAAKKAVKEAIEKAGKDGAETAKKAKDSDGFKPPGLKRGADGKFQKSDDGEDDAADEPADKAKAEAKPKAKEDDEEVDPDVDSLKKILKHRDRLAKAKQAQNQEFQQQQMEFQRQQYEFQRQVQEFQRQQQRLELLRKDPARAVTEFGWDPEEFITSLAQEGTPEGKLQRTIREQQMKLQEMDQWRQAQQRKAEEAQRQYQYQQLAQARQHVEKTFIQGALNEQKFPHMADFYKGREQALIAEGDLVASQYRELTGKEATLEEIAEYIEEQLAERAKLWYEKKLKAGKSSNGVNQVSTPGDSGGPARGGSRGKTLTSTAASERRALAKDLSDLDGDERIQAAREAVRVAMAASSRSAED